MKILVNEMPKKKEECFFYQRKRYYAEFHDICKLNGKLCSFKNESIFGAECRCLEVGLYR